MLAAQCSPRKDIAMHFLIEPVYCMPWIWTLHRDHNKWKRPIEEDNVWAIGMHEFAILHKKTFSTSKQLPH